MASKCKLVYWDVATCMHCTLMYMAFLSEPDISPQLCKHLLYCVKQLYAVHCLVQHTSAMCRLVMHLPRNTVQAPSRLLMEPSTVVIEEVAETEVVCLALRNFPQMCADVLAAVVIMSWVVAWPKVASNIARGQLPAGFRPEEALLGVYFAACQ